MKVPQGTMIGTVLRAAIKAVLVGTLVRVRQLVVEPIVSAITVIFIIVSKRGHYGHTQTSTAAIRRAFLGVMIYLHPLSKPNAAGVGSLTVSSQVENLNGLI